MPNKRKEKKTKKYLHLKATEFPLYGGHLVIIFSNSPAKVKKHVASFDKRAVYAHTWYENYNGHQGFFVILNFDWEYKQISHGTVAHEAIHAVNMIAEDRGFVPNFSNDEPIAYLLSWVTNQIYDFAKEKGMQVVNEVSTP